MGGGNGLKSFMSRERHQGNNDTKNAGGGKDGLRARTESSCGSVCAICRAQFTSVKMKKQLVDHAAIKHKNNTLAECFPDCHQLLV